MLYPSLLNINLDILIIPSQQISLTHQFSVSPRIFHSTDTLCSCVVYSSFTKSVPIPSRYSKNKKILIFILFLLSIGLCFFFFSCCLHMCLSSFAFFHIFDHFSVFPFSISFSLSLSLSLSLNLNEKSLHMRSEIRI